MPVAGGTSSIMNADNDHVSDSMAPGGAEVPDDQAVPSRLTGRLLGLDHGSRRVGVAVSDPTGTIASARGHLEYRNLEQLVTRVAALIDEEAENGAIVGIVIGDPRHMSGEPSAGSQLVADIRIRLRRQLGLPVWCWDERLTTVAAEAALCETGMRGRKRRQRVDAVAAALILQSFLEAIRERGRPPVPPASEEFEES